MAPLSIKVLALWLLMALTTWVPVSHQTAAWHEPAADAVARYYDFATDIARVALDPDEQPLEELAPGGSDDEARARTGLLLASVASFESSMAKAVIDCRKLGPGGAGGPYQTHRQTRKACSSVSAATTIALEMVRESFRVCSSSALLDRLGFYTDGKCVPSWWRSRYRVARAETWWTKRPVAWARELAAGEWQDI